MISNIIYQDKKVKCNYIMFYFITTTYFKNFKYFSEVINEDTKIG